MGSGKVLVHDCVYQGKREGPPRAHITRVLCSISAIEPERTRLRTYIARG